MRPLLRLFWLLPLVTVACMRSKNGAEAEQDAAAAEEVPVVETLSISAETLGPVRLGMSKTEIESIETMTFTPTEVELEGQKTPALRAMRDGKPIGTVELQNDRATRIRIDSSEPKTSKGAHVGMTAKELDAAHGEGKVVTGEGNVCAVFDDAQGLTFCFKNANPDTKEFSELLESNPTVSEILVVGLGE